MAERIEIGLPPAKEETAEELNGIALPPKRKEEDRTPLKFPNSGVDWQSFSEGAQIDDKKATEYEDAMLNTMAFDIPTEQTFRDKKAIDKSISSIPLPKHKKEVTQKTYDGISLLGNPIPEQRGNSKAMGFFDGITILNNYAKVVRSTAFNAWIGGSNELASATFTGIEVMGHELQDGGVDPEKLGPWAQLVVEEPMAIKNARESIGREIELTGEAGRELFGEQAQQFAPPVSIRGKNIIDSPELWTDPIFWTDGIVRMTPHFIATMAVGGAAGKTVRVGGEMLSLTPQVVDKLARATLSVTAGVFGGQLEGAGDYNKAIEMGKSPQDARDAYYRMTLASGALNALSFNFLLNKIPDKAKGKVFAWLTQAGTGRAGAGFLAEGTTEGLEEIISSFNLTGKMGESWKDAITVALLAGPSGAVTAYTAGGQPLQAKPMEEHIKDLGIDSVLPEDRAPDTFPDIPPVEPTAPPTEGIADISAQVEAGTLAEEDALSQIMDRLIEPIQGEEGAITIDTRDTVTIQDEQFDLADPAQREKAIDRGIEQFRETGEIDANSAIADEIIAESLILDELGAEGTAETVMEARRKREIEGREREQADIRQGVLEETLRQRAIDEGLTLFSETGQIDLTSPVALDVIKANILNDAYTVRDNFNAKPSLTSSPPVSRKC
jgi:hypothetical protein